VITYQTEKVQEGKKEKETQTEMSEISSPAIRSKRIRKRKNTNSEENFDALAECADGESEGKEKNVDKDYFPDTKENSNANFSLDFTFDWNAMHSALPHLHLLLEGPLALVGYEHSSQRFEFVTFLPLFASINGNRCEPLSPQPLYNGSLLTVRLLFFILSARCEKLIH